MGPISCPETSEKNHNYLQHNNPEERSSYLLREGSLKSGSSLVVYWKRMERDGITKLRIKGTAPYVLRLFQILWSHCILFGKIACSCELTLVGKAKECAASFTPC